MKSFCNVLPKSVWLIQQGKYDEIKSLENGLISVSIDLDLDNYYNRLEQLYNWAIFNAKDSIDSKSRLQTHFIVDNVHNYYDGSTNSYIFEPILQFIMDYHLGYFVYNIENNMASVSIDATFQKIYDAYMMEMQRLSYYKEEAQSTSRK